MPSEAPADVRAVPPYSRSWDVLRRVIEATEHHLRVPTTWNRNVWLLQHGHPTRVVANWDHSLAIRHDYLNRVLDADRGIPGDKINRNRDAFQAITRVVHAAVRLSRYDLVGVPAQGPGIGPDKASLALAAGLARSWAVDNVRTVLSLADLDTSSRQLTHSRQHDDMPYLTAAARALVKDLADQARRPLDVTHRDLVSAPEDQRWNVMSGWLIDANLTGMMDPQQRAALLMATSWRAHKRYAEVVDIPDRVAAMPDRRPDQRAVLYAAMGAKGAALGARTVLDMNVYVKGKLVGGVATPDDLLVSFVGDMQADAAAAARPPAGHPSTHPSSARTTGHPSAARAPGRPERRGRGR